MERGIRQKKDGHFELPLPLKDERLGFPNNREAVVKRLQSLRGRLEKDSSMLEDYKTFMNDMFERGYAEEVPEEELDRDDGMIWYVPHHGVYHAKKNKIRVVFDCTMEFQGESLNKRLLQGPDMANNMTEILLRFRQDPVAISCDVESMFNQVSVSSEHRDLLRFLWWKDGDTRQKPKTYRMKTHLFGSTSSPACAMYALNATATAFEELDGKAAADFVRDDFYVDDGLTSCPDAPTAVKLIKDTASLCARGGFRLHKFASNSDEVLENLSQEDLAKGLQHALGIRWNTTTDEFEFDYDLTDKAHTRRGILSVVSQVYDPLGFISPFVMTGKMILKDLCCSDISWDEPLTEEMEARWQSWMSEMPLLSSLSVPRCYRSVTGDSTVKLYELHHFCDASFDGYGQCSYIRVVGEDGQISSNLLMSKTRVSPKRTVTMPRLELMAAVTSARVSSFLRQALRLPHVTEYFWTDSQVVLGYIKNESKRFHVFVANRVQTIRDHSTPEQWRYIESASNPADLASRGTTAATLIGNSLWWNGPPFLSKSEKLPEDKTEPQVQDDDPEVKHSFHAKTAVMEKSSFPSLPERLTRFSSWYRAKRAVALCLRYKQKLLNRVRLKSRDVCEVTFPSDKGHLTVEEMKNAEFEILKLVQQEAYGGILLREELDYPAAQEGERLVRVRKRDPLYRLDPIKRPDGLIGVGGRLRRASVPVEVAHPVILPNRGHVTKMIVDHVHKQTDHAGREMCLSELRQRGYWVIRGRSAVQRCIRACVKCKRLRGAACGQKMSDLPAERTEPAPPFTFTGVDAFGPFFISQRRSQVKRWVLMFTCMCSRAIHLEVIHSLDSDSFLNAYRRFVCRRGPIRRLYCDNGTNFTGGKTQLEAALSEQDQDAIRRELLKDNCDWIEFRFNPPHSSHMGGVWERQIRSARAALCSLIDTHGHQLDDELLQTIMAEAENIVNSRPLTYTSMTDTNTVEPITPSQLLTLKSKVVLPLPGTFCKEDIYARRRWRRVQLLANNFWQRWRREFLPTLQRRDKWQGTSRNVKVNDVVLVMDDDTPRGRWPLRRVLKAYPSDDGLVRKVKVLVNGSEYDRPIHRLIVLVDGEDSQSG